MQFLVLSEFDCHTHRLQNDINACAESSEHELWHELMSRPHIPSVPQVMQPFNLKVCKRQVSVQTTQCRTFQSIIRVITNLTHTMNEYFNLKDSKLQLADYFIMIHFISAERVSQSFHRKSFNLTFTDPTSAPYVSNNSPSF